MKTSRHVSAIFRRVARDFICASAAGFGVGVAVTRSELITAKVRLFGGVVLRRYRLSDIGSIRLRRGQSVSFLLVDFVRRSPSHLMFLYGNTNAGEFEAVAAALERFRRPRAAAQRQVQRRLVSARAAYEDRSPKISAVP